MANYVLCHGGWGGGWIWRRVADRLAARGHRVFTPTYTGLGERSHLLTPEVDLETHIRDVLGVLEYEELDGVVLAGHSYGGMVITGVADRARERLAATVYLDAFLPADGQSLIGLARPGRQAQLRRLADERGDGWRIPGIPAADWGVTDPADQAWIDRLSGDHPLATMTQAIRLTGEHERVPRRVYVVATAYDPSPFQPFAAAAKADPAWDWYAIDCHHFINVSEPDRVADILETAAA